MKSLNIMLVAAAALMSSCSVYRSGQTPDDVYYSPTRASAAYVETNNNDDRDGRYYGNNESMSPDDRWLRMRVRNRTRWSAFDDYNMYNDWSYSPFYNNYNYGYSFMNPYGYSYNNYYSSYWNWNSFYNPYYPGVVIINPKTNPAGYTTLRNFNRAAYKNTNYNRATLGRSYYSAPVKSPTNSGTLGNSVRRMFSGNNSGRGGSNDSYVSPSSSGRPVRTYSPSSGNNNNSYTPSATRSSSSGSSSSGSSGSSGGAAGSRPSRR